MRLLDELRGEHDLIERVAGALLAHAAIPADNRDAADTSGFVRFFRLYASHFHHAREEDTLFAALRDRAGLPVDRGPVAVMLADHRRMAELLSQLTSAADADGGTRGAGPSGFLHLATAYVHALWHHIDAENSVLFPECEARLRRNGVTDLPSRYLVQAELEARAAGESLLRRYPPADLGDMVRGEGCIMCPAFGVSCRGLELEWWNEWEWDEFEDRAGGG